MLRLIACASFGRKLSTRWSSSIYERRGLINPITVRPRDGGGYWLIAGLHRLMAVKKLKEKTIRAAVLTGLKAAEAELVEIDENLIRADLTLAERAFHVGRRKELYEQLHPETKDGAVGRKGKSSQNENSFVDQTVATTGKARATVARDATRAKAIVVLPDIVGTSLDQGDELDALAKLDQEEQRKLAQRAQAGEKVSAKTRAKQIVRAEREKALGTKQLAMPTKKYGLEYATREMLSQHGLGAFMMPRPTALVHEAGHAIVAHATGSRVRFVRVWPETIPLPDGSDVVAWTGLCQSASGLWVADNHSKMADDLKHAKDFIAGIAAETLAGLDLPGSSLDEVVQSQSLAALIVDKMCPGLPGPAQRRRESPLGQAHLEPGAYHPASEPRPTRRPHRGARRDSERCGSRLRKILLAVKREDA